MNANEDATYAMTLWTKNLKPVKRINLNRFGIGALISLRDFLNARLWFQGTESHVFQVQSSGISFDTGVLVYWANQMEKRKSFEVDFPDGELQ